ncbi:hypothetical protein CLOSPI_02058 [Thomasclavelia spiroformis DSM 1552]|uniref:Uncharacterized protein n=1 Tax=Thomasclavelia spiroformis DSM 1552 TaxID=428126 RepID=B1C490_9FIRM|nr:hypothetical protein CLOSPI_02058 [Thomasclavelia spiroformis DSM 1552]
MIFLLHGRYSKQKARSRVQAPPMVTMLLTGLFLFCSWWTRENKDMHAEAP